MAHGISDSRSPQVEYLDERNEAWCGGCVSIAADPGLVDRGSLRKKAPHLRMRPWRSAETSPVLRDLLVTRLPLVSTRFHGAGWRSSRGGLGPFLYSP